MTESGKGENEVFEDSMNLPPLKVETNVFPLQLIIVTGTSGSGKTQALKCLEDMGYFCVDNLPPALFQKFTELCLQPEKDVKKVALGIDIRERAFFDDLFAFIEFFKKQNRLNY